MGAEEEEEKKKKQKWSLGGKKVMSLQRDERNSEVKQHDSGGDEREGEIVGGQRGGEESS